MDNRLLLSLLIVTLSWEFMGAYAQNNTTAAPNVTAASMVNGSSTTRASPNNTAMVTTVNATASPTTSMNAANMSANTTNNGTMGAGTTMTNTTAANNISSTTTTATITTALVPNTTVETLQTNITRVDCGTRQLCAAEPSMCDPSPGGSCFFLAAKQDGANFDFQLSGKSDGYIAATVSTAPTLGNNDTTYVCARSGSLVKFFGARLNNNVLTRFPVNVNSVKGKVTGNLIQCSFVASVPTAATRASTYAVAVSTGTYNDTTGDLGNASAVIRSAGVDLANPNTTVTNDITANTTTAPNATASPTTSMNAANTSANTTNNGTMGAVTITITTALVPNTTVETLQTNITRVDCGTKQLCAAEPSMCDPSSGGSCFFLSAKPNGANFDFQLSGKSDGYIAATVSTAPTLGNNETTYVCARSGSLVKFFGARLNNNMLTRFPVSANSVKGKVTGNQIQCSFVASVPTAATRASGNALVVSTGTYNDTTGDLGNATAVIKSGGVNLTDPNATITNDLTANTTTAPTVAGNNTGSNVTTSAPNNTTVSTSAATTDFPVATLQTTISRTNCGSSKLCAAQPSACDPATGVGCFFISAQQQSGQLYNFELSGESSGYVAAGVSSFTSVNLTQRAYICANNNGVVKFFTGTITNLIFNFTQMNVNNVKGAINARKIQCTFTATLPDTAVRDAVYSLAIANGTYNPNTGLFGLPFFRLFTSQVNLSDPTANATNLINGAYPATYQQPLIPALLVTVTMLTFSAL